MITNDGHNGPCQHRFLLQVLVLLLLLCFVLGVLPQHYFSMDVSRPLSTDDKNYDEAQGRPASVSQDCGLNSPRNFAPRFCPVF
jgi:hypothetical protein